MILDYLNFLIYYQKSQKKNPGQNRDLTFKFKLT